MVDAAAAIMVEAKWGVEGERKVYAICMVEAT
jgi:hypothetical protein